MKKFVIALVIVLSMFLFASTALAANVPSAKDYRETKSVTLKIATGAKVKTVNGTYVSLHKGDKVKGYRFYNSKVYAKLSNGKYAYISNKYLRTSAGCKLPKFPKSVKLKTKFKLEGEVLSKGTKLSVQYYAFSKKGFLMAYCYEGFVPTKYLKK